MYYKAVPTILISTITPIKKKIFFNLQANLENSQVLCLVMLF